MEQQPTKDTGTGSWTGATDRIVRWIVVPLVFLTGIYGLLRYVLIGG